MGGVGLLDEVVVFWRGGEGSKTKRSQGGVEWKESPLDENRW